MKTIWLYLDFIFPFEMLRVYKDCEKVSERPLELLAHLVFAKLSPVGSVNIFDAEFKEFFDDLYLNSQGEEIQLKAIQDGVELISNYVAQEMRTHIQSRTFPEYNPVLPLVSLTFAEPSGICAIFGETS
jgi:hypothetical protein